ncbi:MAG: hypothetical protein CMM47_10855 [Rhodospirillaceae bacterium]|nr:hypothetical protein [Rhodospirillaceae bacterium]
MSDAKLLHRIDRLESRHAIAELISIYGIACDDHDMPRLMGLFTPDAVFDTRNGLMRAVEPTEIEAMFTQAFKIRGPAFHWTHDHIVEFDDNDPDSATGTVLSHAETTPHGEPSLAAMRYEDIYRRRDGRWLFAKRTINFLYYVPAREYLTALNQETRVTVAGNRLPADYPENLLAWQEFDARHKKT